LEYVSPQQKRKLEKHGWIMHCHGLTGGGPNRASHAADPATAADAPRGGPIPEPEEVDQHFLAALRAARVRDEESRRSGFFFLTTFHALLVD